VATSENRDLSPVSRSQKRSRRGWRKEEIVRRRQAIAASRTVE
jgi:hypothetical protein